MRRHEGEERYGMAGVLGKLRQGGDWLMLREDFKHGFAEVQAHRKATSCAATARASANGLCVTAKR